MGKAHFIISIILCLKDFGNKAKEMDWANLLIKGDWWSAKAFIGMISIITWRPNSLIRIK